MIRRKRNFHVQNEKERTHLLDTIYLFNTSYTGKIRQGCRSNEFLLLSSDSRRSDFYILYNRHSHAISYQQITIILVYILTVRFEAKTIHRWYDFLSYAQLSLERENSAILIKEYI